MKTLKEKYENKKLIKENSGLILETKQNLKPQLDAITRALTNIETLVKGTGTASQIKIIKNQIRQYARDDSISGTIGKFANDHKGKIGASVGIGVGTALAIATGGLGLPILGAIAAIGGAGGGGGIFAKLQKDPLTKAMMFSTNLSKAYIEIATDIQQDLEEELKKVPPNTPISKVYENLSADDQSSFKKTFLTSGKGAFNKKLSGNSAFEDFMKMPVSGLPKVVNLSKTLTSVVKNVTTQMKSTGNIMRGGGDDQGESPGQRSGEGQQDRGQLSGDNRGSGGQEGQQQGGGPGSTQKPGGGASSPNQVKNIGELYAYLFSKSGKSANDREEKIKHAENYLKNEWGISDTEGFRKFSKFLFDKDFI